MTAIEDYIVKYCVNTGTGLGRVKNKKSTLKRLKDMLIEPMLDTSTTFAQYMALDQDAKLAKKSAPGYWLAAHFREGRRKLEHQMFRSMIVLDLDYVKIKQLDYIRMGFAEINQYYWIMHTTRAHCPEKPRVRVIIPADRTMDATETNAITRLLSMQLADDPDEAIEIPDLVSFRYNQAMFKPSISRGQEYWLEDNPAGVILDVDAFLADNPGWDDYTLLPYQEAEKQRGVVDPNRKMEHPHEKPELLGAWCRTYDVEEAIAEFLSDTYVPGTSETETRYTYAFGTGSNGAVVYDDGLFLHSNHGSDPAEGLHNSFDLVRLHKFGHLDDKAPANTSPGNMPSYKAMVRFAEDDPVVSAELFSHLADDFDDDDEEEEAESPAAEQDDDEINDLLGPPPSADDEDEADDKPYDMADEFDDDDEDPEPTKPDKKDKAKKKTDMSWTANFRRKANGDLEPVLNNIALICETDFRLVDAIGYNEFTMDPVCLRQIRASKINLPSQPLTAREKKVGRKWTPEDDASIMYMCSANEARLGFSTDFAQNHLQNAVLIAGHRHKIHPVKDFIRECHRRWIEAGSPTGNLESLSRKYLHTPDTIFHRHSSRLFLIGAVTRIFEPGCKFDQMLIIRGDTGGGKSTFLRNLAGGFFSEFRVNLDDLGRTVEQMRGNWILEMAEMAKARGDNNQLKDFLSAGSDTIRLAYGKREVKYERQSVMAATSNDDDFLSDPTSVRRFWVWITDTHEEFQIDQKMLKANLHLIWGEAYQAYLDMRAAQPKDDLHLGLQDPEAIREQRLIAEGNRKQTATEAIAEVIQEWLDEERPARLIEEDDTGFAADSDDETPMVRNMVSARDAFEALRNDPILQPYRNADSRTYGKALKMLPGWSEVGKCRRHGQNAVWFKRNSDGPLWIEAEAKNKPAALPEIDDLLG
ncbi:VapE domain-containing protein [Sulfitobacter pontiacus]